MQVGSTGFHLNVVAPGGFQGLHIEKSIAPCAQSLTDTDPNLFERS